MERHQQTIVYGVRTGSMGDAVNGLTEGVSALVRSHLALARMELKRDARNLGKDAAMELAGLPMVLAGYLLLWIGLGFLLALALPTWAAFLVCAALNFAIGGALMAWGMKRAKRDKPSLRVSTEEVQRDKNWLATLKESPEQMRGQLQ